MVVFENTETDIDYNICVLARLNNTEAKLIVIAPYFFVAVTIMTLTCSVAVIVAIFGFVCHSDGFIVVISCIMKLTFEIVIRGVVLS